MTRSISEMLRRGVLHRNVDLAGGPGHKSSCLGERQRTYAAPARRSVACRAPPKPPAWFHLGRAWLDTAAELDKASAFNASLSHQTA